MHQQGKVKRADIRVLDDGTLIYSVDVEKNDKEKNSHDNMPMMSTEHYEYAFNDASELSDAIASDFGLKKMRMKKEEDFASLK